MTHAAGLPPTVETPADARAIEAAATRLESPCGDGTMTWRSWGDGAPVLLLHGGSGSWNHWVRNIAPLVHAGRRVIAPDLPGFGESAPPPLGHDADALPEWVERGLGALIGVQACDVVAFSFGAMVGGFLAASQPARVQRLVLVGAPALSRVATPSLGLRAWSHEPPGPSRDAILQYNLGRIMLARPESIDELALALHAANVEMEHARMKRRRLSVTNILLRTLPQIRCPVAGIWGGEDALYRGRQEAIHPALAHAPDLRSVEIIAGAGHWVQYENAEAFNDLLRNALAEPLAA